MHWRSKAIVITPISSAIEIALLSRALEKQPDNIRVFEKLIQALVFEKSIEVAIGLCHSHLDVNEQAYTKLVYLYKRLGDVDSLISIASQALRHSATRDTELYLAHAYAEKNRFSEAKTLVLKNQQYGSASVDSLRLILSILVKIDEPKKAIQVYQALPRALQGDSGLKLSYLRALHRLSRYTEVRELLNYDTMIVQNYLPELTTQADIAALNQSLNDFFLSHPKQQYEPGEHATRYGSRLHFETDWHPSLEAIESEIKTSIELYYSKAGIDTAPAFELHFWAVTMDKQGHQTPHVHPDGVVSGVYYVRSPPMNLKLDSQTDQVQRHEPAPGCLLFTQAETDDQCCIQPKEGLLVLFPSYFYHQTVPIDHDNKRISIAFDVVRSSTQ
jgi:uncharacterized protein (TIGR02466 family)